MTTLLESEPQTEQGNWTDFKVFIVSENAREYANRLKEELNNPENSDLINEIKPNFNFEDLKIFKKDKIVFIISELKYKWQENITKEIITRAKQNKSKILLITLDNPPLEFEKGVYTFKAKDENNLLILPKLIIGSIYTPGLICIDTEDIYQLIFAKDYGKIDYFSYKTYPDKLNEFEDFIKKNVPQNINSLFIHIEISPENHFEDIENAISTTENILNPQQIIYGAWLNKNYENKEIKISLITFS